MKYPQVYDGDNVHIPRKGYKMMCCDCGLVHFLKPTVKDKKVFLRVWRHNRSTAVARRWRKAA